HKKHIYLFLYHNQLHPVHRQFLPFDEATKAFLDLPRVFPVCLSSPNQYDDSYSFQIVFSTHQEARLFVLWAVLFCYSWCSTVLLKRIYNKSILCEDKKSRSSNKNRLFIFLKSF